ncbi:class 1 fructose-bisphosphatase [Marinovum sp. 2_MG-2023]|uniref:class 1 fructose-bisphosphatase n=1 Tax=unclassified Marinovum TaxID=2647166 RepID=UPI0026E37CE8|nr:MULTISPECIES: class 1 fructose-bisphosphatase [unclassified Marinovum]MDO6731243.1 class 1 fructose-bisphosphatase [Marinovum sp. 2_MG-2023]MDO6780605.1 class 1 fructose-bisphosphatase [Marinovum sp. 1_MG-2023]
MSIHHATLREFLTKEHRENGLDPSLVSLLEDIATSCRIVSHLVHNGAFTGVLGATEDTNVQGETQQQLDVLANDVFVRHCSGNDRVAALVSEEVEEVYWLKKDPQPGDYIVYFDPLDGSSNLALNMVVGSIFSVAVIDAELDAGDDRSVLRPGSKQVCAGYSVYGPATSLVLTTGNGVHCLTHQTGTGEFRVTHPDMTIPEAAAEFAINTSRYQMWDQPIKRYYDECIQGKTGPRQKKFNMRWVAAMVADVHRILTRGGVFIYPCDDGNREMGGKLRLMYEANPMAMIVEQAGGAASTGTERIMDVTPTSHHMRVPVILGSKQEVEILTQYHQEAAQT